MKTQKKYAFCLVSFLSMFLLLSVVSGSDTSRRIDSQMKEAEGLASVLKDNILLKLHEKRDSARFLATLVEDAGGNEPFLKEKDQNRLLEKYTYLAVAKDKELIHFYGREGTDATTPIAVDKLDLSYQLAALTHDSVIEGPLEDSLAGEKVFLFHEPITVDGQWWGSVAVAVFSVMMDAERKKQFSLDHVVKCLEVQVRCSHTNIRFSGQSFAVLLEEDCDRQTLENIAKIPAQALVDIRVSLCYT